MSGQFTPGPWIVATSCSWRRILTQIENKPVCVPTTSRHDGHPDLIASEADLRLIAAAPMLLAALIKCADQLEIISGMVHDERMALIEARAAIAAATGETE